MTTIPQQIIKLLSLSILLTLGLISHAQVKILFDASKAESAGNADWVIDADQHNLDYTPYAHLGGNESNAQQIPNPSQSGIHENTTESYWTGAISAWAVDAVKLGYQVETLPYNGQITYNNSSNQQDLSHYDIYVVCEPNILFSSSEKSAILHFVQNGGSLFMISDHDNSDRNGDGYDSPFIWNDLMENNNVQSNPFGISYDYEFFTETTNNIPNLPNDPLLHGDYGNVSSVEFYGGTSLSLSPSANATVQGVVFRNAYSNTGNYGALCAYASFGSGRVVALGDSSPADDGTGDNGDNLYDGWIEDANGNHERLIMNATIWLASNTTATEELHTKDSQIIVTPLTNSVSFAMPDHQSSNNDQLIIYDVFGREIKSMPIETEINISLPSHGVYIYQHIRNHKIAETNKFIY